MALPSLLDAILTTLWHQLFPGLLLVSALLILADRRLMPWVLLLEYVIVAALLAPYLYPVVAASRLGLGFSTWLILLLGTPGTSRDSPEEDSQRDALLLAGLLYRLFGLGLAGVLTYILWQAEMVFVLPAQLGLASIWFILSGLAAMVLGVDLLGRGVGLLTLLNGIEMAYLYSQRSLVVFGLLGAMHLVVVLAIAYHRERAVALREEDTSS